MVSVIYLIIYFAHVCLKQACIPGSAPSRVTVSTRASLWIAGIFIPASWTPIRAAVTIKTRRALVVASAGVPAGFAGSTNAISGRARLFVFTVTTTTKREINSGNEAEVHRGGKQVFYLHTYPPYFTPTAVRPGLTGLTAQGALVSRAA